MAEQYTPTTDGELRRLVEYARDVADIRHDPLVIDLAQAVEELMARSAAHDAQVLRDAALSGDYGTTAQSALLARADRIAGGTSA